MASRDPVIVGIGWSDYPVTPELDAMDHHALAFQRALRDCGINKSEIDGYMTAGGSIQVDDAATMAEYLRIKHRWIDGTMLGGSSFEFYVQHAAAAIESGMCDTVLVTYGSDLLSKMGRRLGTSSFATGATRVRGPAQFESPWGNVLAGSYAMAARRHMHEFGTTSEQLAEIAVGVREYAALNPQAQYRDPITVEDVISSRMIADPLHKLDCCVISDGGGAFIMTTSERARDLAKPPVYVLGAAGAETHWNISQMPDFTTTAAAQCGPEALGRAGVRPEDVDTVQIYDSFTITVLLLLEDMGFCPKGEGGRFVETGVLRRGGRQPLNTDGGGLSACHPGMRGIFLINEAVRQLRGEAGEAQVPDCEVAVACGSGGFLSCISTVVLGKEGSIMSSDASSAGDAGSDALRDTVSIRALPAPDFAARHYWQRAAEGQLVLQRCLSCQEFQFYPRALCASCGGETEWVDASGRGTLHTYTIIRQNRSEAFAGLVPYAVGIVDLEEGVRMMSNIVECDVEHIFIGMELEVMLLRAADDVGLPFWRPAGG